MQGRSRLEVDVLFCRFKTRHRITWSLQMRTVDENCRQSALRSLDAGGKTASVVPFLYGSVNLVNCH